MEALRRALLVGGGVGGQEGARAAAVRSDDAARDAGDRATPAFSATTWQHSISAQFLASRRCAFMSPSR
jgi:hypothetical protein